VHGVLTVILRGPGRAATAGARSHSVSRPAQWSGHDHGSPSVGPGTACTHGSFRPGMRAAGPYANDVNASLIGVGGCGGDRAQGVRIARRAVGHRGLDRGGSRKGSTRRTTSRWRLDAGAAGGAGARCCRPGAVAHRQVVIDGSRGKLPSVPSHEPCAETISHGMGRRCAFQGRFVGMYTYDHTAGQGRSGSMPRAIAFELPATARVPLSLRAKRSNPHPIARFLEGTPHAIGMPVLTPGRSPGAQ